MVLSACTALAVVRHLASDNERRQMVVNYTSPDERPHAGPEAGPGGLALPRVGVVTTHIDCLHQVLALAGDLGPEQLNIMIAWSKLIF